MELYLRYAANTTSLPNHFFTKAYDCRILYILDGEGTIALRGKTYPLKANDLCYYPAGVRYLPTASRDLPLQFITLNFDFDRGYPRPFEYPSTVKEEAFLPQRARMTHKGEVPSLFKDCFVLPNAYGLRESFLEIEKEFNSSEYYGKEKAATRLQYLFYCLPTYRTDGNHELFSKTLQYIHANLYTLRSNGELGAAMNYHPYYLNKLFKERTGFSIHQYVLKLRLEKAVSLLQNTHHPIRDVAKACGFEDPRHFSSAFSKKYGYTPTQARKNGGILL